MKAVKRFLKSQRRGIAAAITAAVCLLLCCLCLYPRASMAAVTKRDLPIYCVEKNNKVCSLTFDAAWGNVGMRPNVFNGLRAQAAADGV